MFGAYDHTTTFKYHHSPDSHGMGEERAQSEFNMAVSYLNRLNALFYAADESAMGLDASQWFHALMALERELSTEMKAGEFSKFKQNRERIKELVAQNERINAKTGRQEMNSALYEALHDYETQLRRVLKDAGLQNKMVTGAERFFG